MGAFTGELTVVELASNWRVWRLEHEFAYVIGTEGSEQIILVPAGFETDGASVPRLLWVIYPTWGTYSRAAVIHDWLCYNVNRGTPLVICPTKKVAADIFYEAMVVCGTGWLTRNILYWGVRLGALIPGGTIVDVVNKHD